jgi:hypothetical protein
MADLFGVAGRELLDSLAWPEPWQANLESLALVDDLTARIDALELELRRLGADHPAMRLPMTVAGVGWVLASTMGSEIGDIGRFASQYEARAIDRAVPARPLDMPRPLRLDHLLTQVSAPAPRSPTVDSTTLPYRHAASDAMLSA